MRPNKTRVQIEGIIFRIIGDLVQYLLLKRVESRGGFWQPITGGVRRGETMEQALCREILEETGVTTISRIIKTGYAFESEDQGHYKEHVFGVQVPQETGIHLSRKHDEFRWLMFEDAMSMLKWDNNRTGLKKLQSLLKT